MRSGNIAVKFALCAGVEPNLHEAFEKRYGFPLVENVGDDGNRPYHHRPRGAAHDSHPRHRPLGLAHDLRAVDAEGNEVPDGEAGELVMRNSADAPRKGFFSRYLKNPEATEKPGAAAGFTPAIRWRATRAACSSSWTAAKIPSAVPVRDIARQRAGPSSA